jgi:muramidase (phage lysozyme)
MELALRLALVHRMPASTFFRVFVVALPLATAFGTGCTATSATDEDEATDVSESELATNEVCTDGTTLKVTATRLNLRDEADTSAAIVKVLPQGTSVTCVGTTGEEGWVKVSAGGARGWVFGKYVVRAGGSDDADEGSTSAVAAGGTCSPGRASGAVGRFQKAFHDVLAYAEGTRGRSKDGYDVMFNFKIARSCARHPDQCQRFGSSCSTAAGRYQFLTTTWNGAARARSLSSFEPDNQERAAAYLISNVRRATIPQQRALTAAEFSNVMSRLSYEWASLPPGRYGQPSKSASDMRRTYCSIAGC